MRRTKRAAMWTLKYGGYVCIALGLLLIFASRVSADVIAECRGAPYTGVRLTTGNTQHFVRVGQSFLLTKDTVVNKVQLALFRDIASGIDNTKSVTFKIFSAPDTTFNAVEIRPVPASTPVWIGPTVVYGSFSTLQGATEGQPETWTTVNLIPTITLTAGQYVLIAETDASTGTANMLVLRHIGIDAEANTGFACTGMGVASMRPTPTWVALQDSDFGFRVQGTYVDNDGAAAINVWLEDTPLNDSGWKMAITFIMAIGVFFLAVLMFKAPINLGFVLFFLMIIVGALATFIEGWWVVVGVLMIGLVILFALLRGRGSSMSEG